MKVHINNRRVIKSAIIQITDRKLIKNVILLKLSNNVNDICLSSVKRKLYFHKIKLQLIAYSADLILNVFCMNMPQCVGVSIIKQKLEYINYCLQLMQLNEKCTTNSQMSDHC